MNLLKTIVLGFIAGAIATLTAHEFISWLFSTSWTGWDRVSWNRELVEIAVWPDKFVPKIVSDTFWGGLWGSVFGLILGERPQGATSLKGMLMGIVGPALLGVFIAVPLLTGKFPPFFGGDFSKIIPVLFILAGYGAFTESAA